MARVKSGCITTNLPPQTIFKIIEKKTQQFKTSGKNNCGYITPLKQQI